MSHLTTLGNFVGSKTFGVDTKFVQLIPRIYQSSPCTFYYICWWWISFQWYLSHQRITQSVCSWHILWMPPSVTQKNQILYSSHWRETKQAYFHLQSSIAERSQFTLYHQNITPPQHPHSQYINWTWNIINAFAQRCCYFLSKGKEKGALEIWKQSKAILNEVSNGEDEYTCSLGQRRYIRTLTMWLLNMRIC
jgi:hypothetical protein